MIQERSTGLTLVVLLALVVLAQWSTNNAANLILAALTFVNAGAPHLSYKWAVGLAGVVGTLAFPWLILQNLFTFLGYSGALLSAIGGIMICDYYVIRSRRLNVPDLYRAEGQFHFIRGFNPAGLIAWTLGGGLALWQLQYAYIVGLPVAAVVYYALMRMWILPRYPQAEIARGAQDDDYLSTSVGLEWEPDGTGGLRRAAIKDLGVSPASEAERGPS